MQFLAAALSPEAAQLNQEYCVWKEGRDTQPFTGAEEAGRISLRTMPAKRCCRVGVGILLYSP